jgi:hypothetical protein
MLLYFIIIGTDKYDIRISTLVFLPATSTTIFSPCLEFFRRGVILFYITTPTINLMRTLSLNPDFDISILTSTMIFSPCLE